MTMDLKRPAHARQQGTWPLAGLASLCALATPAFVQVPLSIEQAITAGGHTVDGRAMAQLYGPLQEHAPYTGVTVTRGVKYGALDQQAADVFAPSRAARAPRPILIFVHGGGFTGGARSQPDSPFYDNVGVWAARHGYIGITIDYRLAPAATWPAAAEDVAAAVRWVHDHAASYGGDPRQIFLMGHSAGATHVATYGADPSLCGFDHALVRGLIIVSGSFTVENADAAAPADKPLLMRAKAYFGNDPAKFGAQSSLNGLLGSGLPMLVANAEFDPDYFLAQRKLLLSDGRAASIQAVMLAGHNHMSEIDAVNTQDDSLTREILAFTRRNLKQ